MLARAKAENYPVVVQRGGSFQVFTPTGSFDTYNVVETIARNKSFAVHPDSVRRPGLLLRRTNDLCTVWFAWFDGSLHGQFHTQQEALDAIQA